MLLVGRLRWIVAGATLLAPHAALAQGAGGRTYAVIVGVSDYQDGKGVRDLSQASTDARDMAGLLGDAEMGFGADHVILLTSPTQGGEAPTRSNVLTQVKLLSQVRDADTLIFYFSGHGVSETDPLTGNRENYLLGSDAQLLNVHDTGIPVSRVVQQLSNSEAERVIIVLDACRNEVSTESKGGALPFSAQGDGATEESPTPVDPPDRLGEGMVVIYSSRFGDYSYEDPDGPNSFFTGHLLNALRGEADGYGSAGAFDGEVTVDEAYAFVRDQMRSGFSAYPQEPFRSGENDGGAFPLTRVTTRPPDPDVGLLLQRFADLRAELEGLSAGAELLGYDEEVESLRIHDDTIIQQQQRVERLAPKLRATAQDPGRWMNDEVREAVRIAESAVALARESVPDLGAFTAEEREEMVAWLEQEAESGVATVAAIRLKAEDTNSRTVAELRRLEASAEEAAQQVTMRGSLVGVDGSWPAPEFVAAVMELRAAVSRAETLYSDVGFLPGFDHVSVREVGDFAPEVHRFEGRGLPGQGPDCASASLLRTPTEASDPRGHLRLGAGMRACNGEAYPAEQTPVVSLPWMVSFERGLTQLPGYYRHAYLGLRVASRPPGEGALNYVDVPEFAASFQQRSLHGQLGWRAEAVAWQRELQDPSLWTLGFWAGSADVPPWAHELGGRWDAAILLSPASGQLFDVSLSALATHSTRVWGSTGDALRVGPRVAWHHVAGAGGGTTLETGFAYSLRGAELLTDLGDRLPDTAPEYALDAPDYGELWLSGGWRGTLGSRLAASAQGGARMLTAAGAGASGEDPDSLVLQPEVDLGLGFDLTPRHRLELGAKRELDAAWFSTWRLQNRAWFAWRGALGIPTTPTLRVEVYGLQASYGWKLAVDEVQAGARVDASVSVTDTLRVGGLMSGSLYRLVADTETFALPGNFVELRLEYDPLAHR